MIEVSRPVPSRSMREEVFNVFRGMDVSSSDPDIQPGFGRIRENVEVFGGKLRAVPDAKRYATSGWTGFNPAGTGVCTLSYGEKYYGFFKNNTTADIKVVDILAGTMASVTDTTNYSARTVAGRDKVYIEADAIHPLSVIENVSGTWTRRAMGMTAPAITSSRSDTAYPAPLLGTYQYGIELVKKTGDIVTASSGVSRRNSSGDIFPPVTYSVLSTGYITVATPASTDYTHVRLWRSKRLDPDEALGGIIAGDDAVLYCVRVLTKATFLALLTTGEIYDVTPDSNLPLGKTGEYLPTTPEVLDLLPFSSAKYIGMAGGDMVFCGGITDDISGIYPSAGRYGARYEEQYSPADRIGVVRGGNLLGIYGFGEDLVIRSNAGMWRLPGADISGEFIPIDGVPQAANAYCVVPVQGEGIYIAHLGAEIGFISPDYIWNGMLPGKVGTASRDIIGAENLGTLRMNYSGGRLCVYNMASKGCLVLDRVNGFYRWGTLGTVFAVWDSPYSYPVLLESSYMYVIGETTATATYFTSRIDIGPVQSSDMGDGISELNYLRVEGGQPTAVTACTSSAFTADVRDLSLAPYEVLTSLPLEGTFKFQLTDRAPLDTRLSGQRLFLRITFPDYIDQAGVYATVQNGGNTEERYLATATAENDALMADLLSGVSLRFTKPDPLNDYYGNGQLSGG